MNIFGIVFCSINHLYITQLIPFVFDINIMPGNCGRLGGSGGGTRVREQKFKGVDKKTLKAEPKAVRPKVAARQAKKQAKKDEKAEWIA